MDPSTSAAAFTLTVFSGSSSDATGSQPVVAAPCPPRGLRPYTSPYSSSVSSASTMHAEPSMLVVQPSATENEAEDKEIIQAATILMEIYQRYGVKPKRPPPRRERKSQTVKLRIGVPAAVQLEARAQAQAPAQSPVTQQAAPASASKAAPAPKATDKAECKAQSQGAKRKRPAPRPNTTAKEEPKAEEKGGEEKKEGKKEEEEEEKEEVKVSRVGRMIKKRRLSR